MTSLKFNADEILALAERIERNGGAFYRRAAAASSDPETAARLSELADWEGSHEALFGSMRKSLLVAEMQPAGIDADDDTLLYLNAMAAYHVLNREDLDALFAGLDSTAEVLELAIRFERDSIALFQGLEVLVPEAMGKAKVTSLIREEMGHVAFLERERERLGAGAAAPTPAP